MKHLKFRLILIAIAIGIFTLLVFCSCNSTSRPDKVIATTIPKGEITDYYGCSVTTIDKIKNRRLAQLTIDILATDELAIDIAAADKIFYIWYQPEKDAQICLSRVNYAAKISAVPLQQKFGEYQVTLSKKQLIILRDEKKIVKLNL